MNTQVAVGTLKMGRANVLPSTAELIMGNPTGAATPSLDLNGFNQTIAGITYNGGSASTGTRRITNSDATNVAVLTLNPATNYSPTGGSATNSLILTGNLSVVKQGAGTMTLSGINTYSGNTTVSAGTLSLTRADSAADANTGNDLSTVSIAAAAGATLDLAYTGTDEVDKLFIGGVQKAAGVWGAVGSGAANTDPKITGTGTLTVASSGGTTYASWIAGFGLVGPDALVTADPDKDGIANAVEMVLGGNPATGMDTALLPTLELVTNPAGVPAGDYLLFTYRRSADSELALLTARAETDTDLLAPWTPAINGAAGVVIQEDLDYLLFSPAAPANTDRVRVYVPRGTAPKIFGRLNVVVP